MKKIFKKFASAMLALVLSCGLLISSFAADSSVTYEGGAEKFVFLPGSEYTDTDLFDNFKGVMPGDSIEQKIMIKNTYKGCDYVNIYMRAETHDAAANPLSPDVEAAGETIATMSEFLSQLSMSVHQGNKEIYRESPDQLDGLSENVLLGSFDYGESTELLVRLDVPIELGNKYANRVGEVDWVFTVEHRNRPGGGSDGPSGGGGSSDPTPTPGGGPGVTIDEGDVPTTTILPFDVPLALPQTGTLWWLVPVLAIAGIMIFLGGVIKGRKSKDDEEN